jgi:hypothetical protein
MGWIRQHIATAGLKLMIEKGGFGLPVELTPPAAADPGQVGDITTNEDGDPLMGQVIYDFDIMDPESGDKMTVKETMVTLRKTALRVVPEPGQTWGVRIPLDPSDPETLTQFIINTDQSLMDGQTAGFIILNLKTIDQSS